MAQGWVQLYVLLVDGKIDVVQMQIKNEKKKVMGSCKPL